MPFWAYYLTRAGELRRDLSEKETVDALKSGQGLLWVNVPETTEQDSKFLGEVLGFHHLAVEDCVSPLIHSPKIDDFGDYLFIIVHGINYARESEIVETAELAIFLGPNFVVSSHSVPVYCVEATRHQIEANVLPMKHGADFLAHALADTLIDNVLPTIDRMSEIAGDIEEETVRSPRKPILEAILKLKRSTLQIHRVMAPQREVLNRLSRGEFPIIRSETQIFYRDIYDHLVRIEDLNQTIRDRADNALATYLSSIANQQNETMRTLAIVATIFMPLTLLAGIYGMNFEYMPELRWKWGYFAVLGVMVTTIGIVIWRFWVAGWIARGRRQVGRVISLAIDPKRLVGYIEQTARRQHPHLR